MKYLIVDDEPLVLRDIGRMVKEIAPSDSEIFCADNYEEALEYARQNELYVAFLDIDMPGMTGLELAKHLKDIRPDINIVFVTAYSEYMGDAWDMYVSGYLLKPVQRKVIERALEHLRYPVRHEEDKLTIQCFGNFECFYKGEPMKFERLKSREMLAYLVDRRGAKVSTNEIRTILFEEEADSMNKKSYIRTLASDIRKTLGICGLQDVLKHERDGYYLNLSKVDCDYYRYLKGDITAVNSYHGEYMIQYSWAEMTVGSLESNEKQTIKFHVH
ncbi:MAG: response regulator [Lachnospiraceae bacterium]|nr:response regulator [Lachnospiraceae bacterium]